MSDPTSRGIVTVRLSDDEAMALAQMVKRIGWSDMRQLCADDPECHWLRSALGQVQTALAGAGYEPR